MNHQIILWCVGCLAEGIEGEEARVYDDLGLGDHVGLIGPLPNCVEYEIVCLRCGGQTFYANIVQILDKGPLQWNNGSEGVVSRGWFKVRKRKGEENPLFKIRSREV